MPGESLIAAGGERMFLVLLAYFGGVLTILSPCILPVLPFVFARSDQPFRKSGLPLLAGMCITFAVVASLATVGGGWAVRANQFGRIAALVLFALFGLTLLFSSLADRLSRPLVQLGNRLSTNPDAGASVLNSFLLGIGTGLLWAPCAGPILGLILTGAALQGASARTALLLLSYAAGAATSLAVALLAGGRLFAAMKRGLGVEEWIRRALGVAVLAAVAAVAFGLDRGVLTRLSLASTGGLEQRLLDRFHPPKPIVLTQTIDISDSVKPDLSGATAWINSPPLTLESLHGKVVLVDFWTYSCINCLRTLPYIKAWNEKYKGSGLVIIGVHTPEFPFEKDEANVRKAVKDLGVTYPVPMDNNYKIWRSFNNEYWPADYFIDATGTVRFHHFGEGAYDESEKWIRTLLEEANHAPLPQTATTIAASGTQAAADANDVQSPETYVGYARAQNFASPGGFNQDDPQTYRTPSALTLNQWALAGKWKDEDQLATSLAAGDSISYRFHARDLHLVLGPAADGKPVRFRVTLEGQAPGANHGVDTDAEGFGVVTGDRLYQLIRQQGSIQDRTFRIEFLVPGVRAYSFTFG
jgi:cytochrome c biogenesis protein CcdA/thiol-disulfide isomerase/thioredoxin